MGVALAQAPSTELRRALGGPWIAPPPCDALAWPDLDPPDSFFTHGVRIGLRTHAGGSRRRWVDGLRSDREHELEWLG